MRIKLIKPSAPSRLYIMDRAVVYIFYGLILWFVWSYFGTLLSGIKFVFEESRAFVSRKQGVTY